MNVSQAAEPFELGGVHLARRGFVVQARRLREETPVVEHFGEALHDLEVLVRDVVQVERIVVVRLELESRLALALVVVVEAHELLSVGNDRARERVEAQVGQHFRNGETIPPPLAAFFEERREALPLGRLDVGSLTSL